MNFWYYLTVSFLSTTNVIILFFFSTKVILPDEKQSSQMPQNCLFNCEVNFCTVLTGYVKTCIINRKCACVRKIFGDSRWQCVNLIVLLASKISDFRFIITGYPRMIVVTGLLTYYTLLCWTYFHKLSYGTNHESFKIPAASCYSRCLWLFRERNSIRIVIKKETYFFITFSYTVTLLII